MSKKPRNDKTGKFLSEGKESQMIRLDKDVADLGREEIQTRVSQGVVLEKMAEAIFAVMNHLYSQDFIEESRKVEIDVDELYNFFETFREEDLEEN